MKGFFKVDLINPQDGPQAARRKSPSPPLMPALLFQTRQSGPLISPTAGATCSPPSTLRRGPPSSVPSWSPSCCLTTACLPGRSSASRTMDTQVRPLPAHAQPHPGNTSGQGGTSTVWDFHEAGKGHPHRLAQLPIMAKSRQPLAGGAASLLMFQFCIVMAPLPPARGKPPRGLHI